MVRFLENLFSREVHSLRKQDRARKDQLLQFFLLQYALVLADL